MASDKTTKASELVAVRTVPGVTRRCRAGHVFGPERTEVALSAEELAAVRADELLDVAELPAKAATPAPAPAGSPSGAANKGMTPTPGPAARG